MTPAAAPDALVQAMRGASLAALAALVALGLAWELWLAPTGRGTLAVKVLPLVFAFAGLARHRLYTYRWLSLLVWVYFCEGVVRATTESGRSQALAVAEVLLTSVLFVTCVLYIRRRLNAAPRDA
jgi:uncharacterized membrane protein